MPDLFDLYGADTSSELGATAAPTGFDQPKPETKKTSGSKDLFDLYAETGDIFDPEGDGYDYASAESAGLAADITGHWPSRNPVTGQILKGRAHPTFNLTEKGEAEAGMEIYKQPDGKYYSRPMQRQTPAQPRDLFDLYGAPEKPQAASSPPVQGDGSDMTPEAAEAAITLSLRHQIDRENEGEGELSKMWDDLSLKKLAKVARRVWQSLLASSGDIAQAEIGQNTYLQDIYKNVYNPENKFGRRYLETLKREAEETIARDEGFIRKLPEVEDPAFRSIFGQIIEGAVTGAFRFAPTVAATMASPALGYSVAVAQIAGAKRDELKKAGKSDQLAWDAAMMEALPAAAVETASNVFQIKTAGRVLNKFAKRLGLGDKAREVLKWFLKGGTSESLEEITQEQWSLFTDSYVEAPDRTPQEIAAAAWEKIWTIENLKNTAMAGATGFAGGVMFQGAAGMVGLGARAIDKAKGVPPSPPAPAGEVQVRGPVEPVPQGQGGLGFKPIAGKTTFETVDDTGAPFKKPKDTRTEEELLEEMDKIVGEPEEGEAPALDEKKMQALAGYVDAMFDDMEPAELDAFRKENKIPEVEALIAKRLGEGKQVLGEKVTKSSDQVTADLVSDQVKKEPAIKLPAGQGVVGSDFAIAASTMKESHDPSFTADKWRPVKDADLNDRQKVTHALADAIGSRVSFYDGDSGTVVDNINGFYEPGTGRIFINKKAAAPELFVLGHESSHQLEAEHPDLYQKLQEIVMDEAANFKAYKGLLAGDRKTAKATAVSDFGAMKEFTGDITGELFTRASFWKRVNQEDPNLFKKLADIVRRLLLQIKRSMTKGAHHAKVKNLERIEAAVAEVYGEAIKRNRAVEARQADRRQNKIGVAAEQRKGDRRVADKKTRQQYEAIRDMVDNVERSREIIGELIDRVYTDELMGIGSKAAFFEALVEDHDKSPVDRRSVVMMDIDNFSWFNDVLGHPLGDELLQTIGKLMKDSGADVYRVGGEELGILTPDPESAIAAANKIRNALEETIIIEHVVGNDVTLKDGTSYAKGDVITVEGVGVSYGIGQSYKAADDELQLDKGTRTRQGLRADKGGEAKRVRKVPGAAKGAVSAEPGQKPGAAEIKETSAFDNSDYNLYDSDNWLEISEFAQVDTDVEFKAPKTPKSAVVSDGLHATVRTGMATTGSLRAGSLYAKTPAEAASLLAHIRKAAQENLYLVSVDKKGKVLEIHRYVKGLRGSAQASITDMAGATMQVKGAVRVYMAHNHPSQSAEPSLEDIRLSQSLKGALELADIEMVPLLLAGTKWVPVSSDFQAADIPAAVRKKKLNIRERVFSLNRPGPNVGNSLKAIAERDKLFGKDAEGFLLANTKLNVVGFLEYPKGKTVKAGAAELIKAIEKTNAAGGIFFSNEPLGPSSVAASRGNFLRDITAALKNDFSLFDFIAAGQSLRDQQPSADVFSPSPDNDIAIRYAVLDRENVLLSTPRLKAKGGSNWSVKKEVYSEQRGETGPFHDTWRVYNKKGDRSSKVFTSEAAAQKLADELNRIENKTQLSVKNAAFQKWFGKSVVAYAGEPMVVFHGTSSNFTVFKTHAEGEPREHDNYLGPGAYFTDSFDDANANYTAKGPDRVGKISSLMDEYSDLDNDAQIEILLDYLKGYPEAAAVWVNELSTYKDMGSLEDALYDDEDLLETVYNAHWDDALKARAAKDFGMEHEGALMPVFLKIERPLDFDEQLEVISPEYNEETEEYEGEYSGPGVDLVEEIVSVIESYSTQPEAAELRNRLYEHILDNDSISADDILEIILKDVYPISTDTGDTISPGAFVREAAEALGYDGITMNAGKRFGRRRGDSGVIQGMEGVYDDTVHYLPFNPRQIKSAIGNKGTWSSEEPSILLSTKTKEFKKWFEDSKVVDADGSPRRMFHSTDAREDFEAFRRGRFDIGIHFGTKEQANDRLKFRSAKDADGQRLYPVYLKIKKPLRLYDAGAWDPMNLPPALRAAKVIDEKEYSELIKYEHEWGQIESDMEGAEDDLTQTLENLQAEFAEEVTQLLESKGFDGIVYKNKGEIEGMAEIMTRLDAVSTQPGTKAEKDKRRSEIYKEKKALEESDKVQDSYIVFRAEQVKSVFNTKPSDNPHIMLSAKRARFLKEPTPEQFKALGPNAYQLGHLGDPEVMLSAKNRMAEQKWAEIPFEQTQFFILNNRLARELQVFEWLFGPSEKATIVPGLGRKPARSIRPHDLLAEIFRTIESGEAAEIMDRKIDPKVLAEARGLSKKSPGKDSRGKRKNSPSEEFVRVVEMMRQGALLSDDPLTGKETLGNNAKAGLSFDLLLATCDPTEQCRFCYAAETMLRQNVIDKALRNTYHILMDFDGWARKAAAEVAKVRRPDLPFIRLQGSGDFLTVEQLDGYNALARYADRPIQIFSRHHEMLRLLKGTSAAPFIKMGSVDATLYKYYGLRYLTANMAKHGIANAWLYTDVAEIKSLEKLDKNKSLGLILAADPDLHKALPADMKPRSCPCDAMERYFISSCRQCGLSQMGCFAAFARMGIDTRGKVWQMDNPRRPKAVAPMLAFMRGAGPMSMSDFILQKAQQIEAGPRLLTDKKQLIKRAAAELGIDPLKIEFSPTVQAYLDITLSLLRDSVKKTQDQLKRYEAGEKAYIVLYDRRFPGDTIKTIDPQIARDHLDLLQWLMDQAVMGKAYLVGGDIQKPVAIKNGELLGQPEVIGKQDAKTLNFSVKTSAGFNPDHVRAANATSRPAGVGRNEAKVPKAVKALAKKGARVLDFGAGRPTRDGALPHTGALEKAGFKVTAYEFGENFDAKVHDGNALKKRYDVVFASNVANVQMSPDMFRRTIAQMAGATTENGGRLIVNMPANPRKGFLANMPHREARKWLRRELKEHFNTVETFKHDPEVMVASGKRKVLLSVKAAVDRLKGDERFRQWFAGSDLKHANGSPMVLYHGTRAMDNFSQFATTNPGKLLDQLTGFHVAADPKMANEFTDSKWYSTLSHPSPGRIMPLLVRGKVHILDQQGFEGDYLAINQLVFETVMAEDPEFFKKWFLITFEKYKKDFKDPQQLAKIADRVWGLLKEGKSASIENFSDLKTVGDMDPRRLGFLNEHSSFGRYCMARGIQGMQLGYDGRMQMVRKFRKIMVDRGITALQYHNTYEGGTDRRAYIVLDPTAIKSVWNRGTFTASETDIMLSTKKIEWARAMNAHLERAWPESATPQQFYALADTWAKKGSFKLEELEWSGLSDWAKDAPAKKVSKAEALVGLIESQFQVEEVVRSHDSSTAQAVVDLVLEDLETAAADTSHFSEDEREALWEDFETAKDEYLNGNRLPLDDFLDILERVPPLDRLVVYETHAEGNPSGEMPRHGDYQLEGGSEYHELVMTAPGIGKKEESIFAAAHKERLKAAEDKLRALKRVHGIENTLSLVGIREDARIRIRQAEAQIGQLLHEEREGFGVPVLLDSAGTFISETHWPDLINPLVHLRFNSRVDVDGRKVMFIEEIQSDWHEQGRDHGYHSGVGIIARLLTEYENLPLDYGKWSVSVLEDHGVPEDLVTQWYDSRMRGRVPEAPFKNTGSWVALALKRAVRWGVEHGFDRVAWTPGLIQVERYQNALNQVVDEITVGPPVAVSHKTAESTYYEKNGLPTSESPGKTVYVMASKNGEIVFAADMAVEGQTVLKGTPYTLEQVIGKEMASKVAADPDGEHNFAGDKLTIGGHGLRIFYDQIIPAAANKLFNKTAFGNAKVSTTRITADTRVPDYDGYNFVEDAPVTDASEVYEDESIEVWSLDITDQMRAKAKDLPLFSVKASEVRPARHSVYLRNYLEAVATPEALKALSLREAGIPFWHEFHERHAANGRASAKDIKRLYTDLYGAPEKMQIGRHQVMIGTRKSVPMLMVKAYHGSRDFDQFSIDYVGTGEKVQAFGWGLYFTDLKSVARHYAKKIGGRYSIDTIKIGDFDVVKDGKLVKSTAKWSEEQTAEREVRDTIRDTIANNASAVDVTNPVIASDLIDFKLSVLRERMLRYRYNEHAIKLIDKILAGMQEIGWKNRIKIAVKKGRTIYKVALFKDKDPSEYKFVDWYASPIEDHRLVLDQMAKEGLIDAKMWAEYSEYHKKINAIMAKHRKAIKEYEAMNLAKISGKKVDDAARAKKYEELEAIRREFDEAMDKHPGNLDDFTEYFLKGHPWSTKYGELVRFVGSPREASMLMLRAGIQGVRFPAGSISGGVKPQMAAKIDGKPIKLTKWAQAALYKAKQTYGVMQMTPAKLGIRLEAELEFRPKGITPAGEEQIKQLIAAAYAGTLTHEEVQPQNYVVFDDSVVTIEKKINFSAKADPELQPLAADHVGAVAATMPPAIANKADLAEDVLDHLAPEIKAKIKANEGIPVPGFVSKLKKTVLGTYHGFTRSFSELDSQNYGEVINVLRLHKAAGENAGRRALEVMANLLDGLRPKQYSAFRLAIIMDDMMRDIESGLLAPNYDAGETLPFGFASVAAARNYRDYVHGVVQADAKTADAFKRRQRFNRKLKELLVKHDLLDAKVLEDDRYFHHQVLEYRALRDKGEEFYLGAGLGQQSLQYRQKGWQKARQGSLKEYNTDYAQAEIEVLAQAFLQLETKATLNRVRKIADFTAQAKALAKIHKQNTGEEKKWEDFIPDGYVAWKPAPGSAWYKASTISDRILDKVLAGEMVLGAEHVKDLFVKGKDKTWWIPAPLANELNTFGGGARSESEFARIAEAVSAGFQTRWKAWTLISPFRVIKYNVNNMSGDIDIAFAYDPLVLKYMPAALKDLIKDQRGKPDADLAQEIELAKRLDVIGSGWSVQEITQVMDKLGQKGALKALTEEPFKIHQIISRPAQAYWETAKMVTGLRENILRLAAFRMFKDKIAAGKTVYGASKKSEVDAISDPTDKAAKLARELIGDYGNISPAGQWLRRHMIPFYSWMEVNAPRYVRLIANLRHEGQGAGNAARSLASMAVGGTLRLGFKGTLLGAKLAAMAALISLWNLTFFPDEEDELGEAQRRQLHLILGRREDGSIISIRVQGALSDAMSWFGGEDIVHDVRDVASGRKGVMDLAIEAAEATPKKLINAVRPEVKSIYELITKKSLYPDPANPRAIRDRYEYIARTFSLDKPYTFAAGKPARGGTLTNQLLEQVMSMAVYSSDPGESAYYNALAWEREYLEKIGEDTFSFTPNEKSNALYYYKRALRLGDLKAAQKYLDLYGRLGGTPKTMVEAVKRMHPLAMIAGRHREGFLSSLSLSQAQSLDRAIDWYFKTYQGEAARELKMTPPPPAPVTLRTFKLGN